jgi:rhodanese-related sulfurtransferase
MKSLVIASLLAAAPAALACEGHGEVAQAGVTTTTVAANADKAATPQKSTTATPVPTKVETKADAKAAEVTFKMTSVDAVAKTLELKKKDAKVAFAIFDANGKDTRAKEGIIPTAILLNSSSEYDLALLPKDKAAAVVFYCASEKCTASHTAAKRAMTAGHTDVAVLGAGISGWVKAGQAVDKPVG